jgi:sodium-dependent dicarboxylate transporter 2/3/5
VSRGEWVTALVFASAALCWVSRQFVVDLLPTAPAWLKTSSADTIIALVGAMLLFVIPVNLKKGQFVLEWKQASKLPWDVLILFGGGLSVAAAFESTLFAQWLGAQAAVLQGLPLWMIIGIIVLSIIFLSELASNVATCTAFLPVAAALAVGMGSHPLLLAVPATLAASAAFMLPVGTPPNAIVFGTGQVSMRQMVRAGIGLNLSFAVMITLFGVTLVRWVFGV